MALQMISYHGKELFSPKYDRVFKALLLSKDKDYTHLASFLTGILAREIRPENIISASSTELPANHGKDKIVRLDFKVRFMDGAIVNIELQVGKDLSMGQRSLYQLSRLLTTTIDKGQEPEKICPVIAINILDFDYITDGDGYHNRYRMKNMITGAEMPGAHILEVHYIELTKFPPNAGNKIEELWVKFLTAQKEEELDMLTEQSPIMASLVEKLVYASGTKELREQMDAYKVNEVKNRLTIAFERDDAKQQGIQQGIQQGFQQGKLAIARKMKAAGKSVNEILEFTDLPIEDVLQL